MDRQQQLLRLGQRLAAATAASDWDELAALNTLMASSLPALAAQGKWTPAERAALAALRQLHGDAVQRAQSASTELGKHLQHMTTHKEGWLAYALDNEFAGTEA
ncbi:hypothetical protein [Pseudoduganella buxea]|uniref:Flagellar protein FliT n=1 Tax=Pseudoduganella buxea TaxID=1949069 RepID=A0A6I3STA6_9BURK|nr:hypothetical protein [Pseudoduganella buxea]MTV52229.1 hypothetical protein [Pseudoduganella buxea]GGB87071.1 hypothetical protein GCM10011572_06370 [Pseudoduganella buxea]